MFKRKSKLDLVTKEEEVIIEKVNLKIEELGTYTSLLYDELNIIQDIFDQIRNVPSKNRSEYGNIKQIRLNWKYEVDNIQSNYKNFVSKNAGTGAAGLGTGLAVVSLGPTVAMGFATTFGAASTGTAISTLSGAAATNAALSWLGGGALAAGGGGIIAGKAFLTLFGPVGWSLFGISIASTGLTYWKGRRNKRKLDDILSLIVKRDNKSKELASIEIEERIARIKYDISKLKNMIQTIGEFGIDYNLMTDAQQYELGSYVNFMNSTTQLLVNPIEGLQPKYDKTDFDIFNASLEEKIDSRYENLIIFISNLMYEISVNNKEKILLWKHYRNRKDILTLLDITKKDFRFPTFELAITALDYKYNRTDVEQQIVEI